MPGTSRQQPSRRAMLNQLVAAAAALPLIRLLPAAPNDQHDEWVEIDGWILKRSDVA